MSGLGEGDREMKKKTDLLAYCGFYCGDCLGHTGVIADAAEEFMNVLERYKFDRTVKCMFPDGLRDYSHFSEMLKFLIGLRCGRICREREDTGTSCVVRKCCREHGFYACYECGDLKVCEKLKSLNDGLHYDSCMKNFEAIKEMGLENWIIRRKRFHYWDGANDCP
jgi:hypothetical protein